MSMSPAKMILGLTIFLSAFLIFQIQPLMAKILLPIFGGSSATWITCLMFFQTFLLAGYFYSFLTSKLLSPRNQALLHIVFIAAAISQVWRVDSARDSIPDIQDPTSAIGYLLVLTTGLPYLLLASTSPLLQSWLNLGKSAASNYRLFALSNFGSMLALLSYPLVIEPNLSLDLQLTIWIVTFCFFAFSCALAAFATMKVQSDVGPAQQINFSPQRIKMTDLIWWLALSFFPSALLMAATEFLTRDVAPIPLIWVIPLALYLLSFILCFESSLWYQRKIYFALLLPIPMALCWLTQFQLASPSLSTILLFLGCCFVFFMLGHGELARRKPAAANLTLYFLVIALGGVLGGLAIGLVAPNLFSSNFDLSIVIVLSYFISVAVLTADKSSDWKKFIYAPKGLIIFTFILMGLFSSVLFLAFEHIHVMGTKLRVRNFYGALKVTDLEAEGTRNLTHGRISHGQQLLDPEKKFVPTSYYGGGSGAELTIGLSRQRNRPEKVGIVGLGAGTLAAYGRDGDSYKFYEINPLMVDIANSEFSYLKDSMAKLSIVLGDARLTLEKESANEFDILFVDAFSGDAIPIHLLTIEAFELYFRHLKADGLLAMHISNRYLNLIPVMGAAMTKLGLHGFVFETKRDIERQTDGATWVTLAKSSEAFSVLKELAPDAQTLQPNSDFKLWTDDYSSILNVMDLEL